MSHSKEMGDQVITAIRRVIRAVDQHSRTLVESHGLTGPQALILKTLQKGELTPGQLASAISLSHGTVTDILNRLEQRGLIQRVKDTKDRRRVLVTLTATGRDHIQHSPPLLQEQFIRRFEQLEDWEQTQLLSSLQRIAAMMNAEGIDASPVLSSGAINASPAVIDELLEADSHNSSETGTGH